MSFLKIKLLLKSWLYRLFELPYIGYYFKSCFQNLKSKTVKDYSHKSDEILNLVKRINFDVFPMFGTLLSIHRDKEFIFADDFDFATFDKSILKKDFFEFMKGEGGKFISFSVANSQVVELSFDYNGIKIDFFLLEVDHQYVVHKCQNFRTEIPKVKVLNKLIVRQFETHFEVKYPKFNLYYDKKWSLLLPTDCEGIFIKHYGNDWNVRKTSNFIDFDNYEFIKSDSYLCESNNEAALLSELCNCFDVK